MSACDVVTLKGGVSVPLVALQLLWQLEGRGLRFRVDGADIIVNPKTLLTDVDRQQLRALKPAVITLITYCHEVTL